MQKFSIRMMINICLIILFILVIIMGFKVVQSGQYRLFAIIMTGLATMAVKNNIQSGNAKLITMAIGAILAILAFLFLK